MLGWNFRLFLPYTLTQVSGVILLGAKLWGNPFMTAVARGRAYD